jgi:hypothetical protein
MLHKDVTKVLMKSLAILCIDIDGRWNAGELRSFDESPPYKFAQVISRTLEDLALRCSNACEGAGSGTRIVLLGLRPRPQQALGRCGKY